MTGQFQLTDDQLAIQETAQRFTADRITPFAAQWDEDKHFPRDVVRAAGELGFVTRIMANARSAFARMNISVTGDHNQFSAAAMARSITA